MYWVVLTIALILGVGTVAGVALRALMNYDLCMPDVDDVI